MYLLPYLQLLVEVPPYTLLQAHTNFTSCLTQAHTHVTLIDDTWVSLVLDVTSWWKSRTSLRRCVCSLSASATACWLLPYGACSWTRVSSRIHCIVVCCVPRRVSIVCFGKISSHKYETLEAVSPMYSNVWLLCFEILCCYLKLERVLLWFMTWLGDC